MVLLDVGANVEVRPEHLVQFAHMGAAFSERVLGCRASARRPAVGRGGAGEGDRRRRRRPRAARRRHAEFTGNVEGDELAAGEADVVVTDGFTGNVALKLMEGTARSIVGAIREAARSGTLSKIGGLLLRPKLRRAARPARPGERWAAPTCSACAGWW